MSDRLQIRDVWYSWAFGVMEMESIGGGCVVPLGMDTPVI
jgi:hypothetical protein